MVGEEEYRQDGPLLTEVEWDNVLRSTGFDGAKTILWDMPDAESHHSSAIITTATVKHQEHYPPVTIVVDKADQEPSCIELETKL